MFPIKYQPFLPLFPMNRKQSETKRPGEEKACKEPAVGEEANGDNEEMEEERKTVKSSSVSAARRGSGSGSGVSHPCCQAERCGANLAEAKRYHRRHKICEAHSKAPIVIVGGLRQRFCQQCSRFHELTEFDEAKRSCRRRLAGHNERRRKSSSESQGEGSSHCRQADQGVTMQLSLPGSPAYKHFQIR